MKKFLSIMLAILMVVTMLPMSVLPASAAENLDYNIKLEVVDWAVYETSGELIGEFNAVEHGDAFYDVSLTQADDGTFTCSYQIALERNDGNTAWGESSISFKIDSCEDEFMQEFEKSFYSRYNIFYNLKVTRSAGDSHTFKDATCVAPKTCAICGVTEGDIDATAHSWANLDGICANGCGLECTHENQTGSVCEICGEHICSYNNGFCTGCDAYEPATDYNADGVYEIYNAGQLFWFAQQVNEEGNKEIKCTLRANIDLENRPWTPIGAMGEENSFRGVFDGLNYAIRGLYVEGSENGVGFFGEVRTGTVRNFTIYGEVVVNTEVDYVGGVIGSICGVNGETDLERNGAIIQNITSYVNVTAKAHGIGMIGGFVGHADHQSLIEQCSWYGTFDAGEYRVDSGAGGFIGKIQENTSEVTIRNCGAYGTIKTNYAGDYNNTATIYMGGFLSFSNTNAKTTLENCLFAGRFERGENLTDEARLGAFGTLRSVNAIKNCYYLGDDGLAAVHSDSNLKPGSDNVAITSVTGEELRSNTIATRLGECWTQGEHYPVPHNDVWEHSHSYTYADNGNGTHDKVCDICRYVEVDNEAHSGGTASCTEQAKCERCGASYGELIDHSYTNGACSACGAVCTHESYENGECTVCGTACAHDFDSVGLCNVCDLRKVWLKTSSWETPTIFCSDTSLEIPMTKDTETELWYGYVPETLEGFIFRSLYTNPHTGSKLCYQTELLSLPENSNCYRAAGSPSTAKDESCTYYTYGGNWYFHPCTEHTWESGQCSLCGLVCSHTGGEQTCDGYQCQVCGSWYGEKLPHNFYDGTGKCLECGEFLAVLQETNSYRTIYYSLDQIASGYVFEYGTSLKLLADIHMEHGACLEMRFGEFTLDLNGYTLYSNSNHAVYVCENLTVMDSSSAGNGQIRSSNSATGSTTGYPTAALYGMTDCFHITVVGDVALNGIVTFLSNNNAGSGTFDLTQWDNAVDSSVHIIHGTSAIYSSVLLPTGYGLTYEGAFVSSTFPVRASATLLVAKCNNHTGGTATCSKQAVCTCCGEGYGEFDPDNHASDTYTYTDNGDGTHTKTHECGVAVGEPEAHTIENHVCTACGAMEIVVSFNAGDYEWKTGDTLYFCRVSGDNEWEEYAFTATVAEDGTVTWTPDKTLYWDGTGEHKLVVRYPEWPGLAWDNWGVGADQTTSEKLRENDLMKAIWSGIPTTDTITLNLKHRLAKVSVNYEIAEDVAATVSKAEIYSLTQYLFFDTNTLDRVDVDWTKDYNLWINSYHTDNQFTAFVSPDAYAADGNFIKITLSDGTVREVKMNKAVTFEEGAEYTYTVVITADGAYLTCADECTFEYTDNEDGTHNKVCSECGYVAASENHTLTYSVDGNTITAYCSANCGYSGTATISATGKTYDGNAVEVVVSKTGSLENTDIPVTLTKDGEAFTGAPVNAGTYTASIGIGENENAVVASVEFIIENANPVIAAAPTPNTLTYIGEAQYLISAGEAVGGTMVYSLTENGEYTTSIPQGTNAGDYTVWYYVQGDANRNDSAKASVSVNIAKATVTVTANDTTITYGEAPINTGVTYSGFVNGEDETVLGGELAYTYTYTQNGNVGDYSITPEGLTADNYEITFVDGTLTVEQIDIGDIIDEMKINLEQYSYVYDGTEKKPKVTSITVDGVTLTEGTDYTVRYEDNVNVGEEATAVITFEGNYDGTFRKWFTITKAYYNLTAPTPNTLTYNGEDQYLVSAGTVEGADFEYSLDGVSWSTSIPQAKDVGNYTVYYRVLADENHYGIEGTVDVTIKECTHEWGEGVLTRPVHDTVLGSKDGYYTYTCTVCGEEKTEAVKSADYSAYEAVSEEINALLQSDELTDAAKQAIYSAANECGHLSNDLTESEQNIVDDLVAELEKIVADAEEKIASGEYVKADYTEIDEAIASVDEALENATISEGMANELSDIKSQLEALKENENTSMADAAELLERVKAVAETMADCANGIHSFTKYEETEAPECGKAGKEVASCDHGCGATDEKEIPALTHKDEDGDLKCDHGCGHEFEQPVEPEQPDTPDEPEQPEEDGTICEYCGNNHNNPITRIFCKITQFFIRLFTFLGFWE